MTDSTGDVSKLANDKGLKKQSLTRKLQCVIHLVRANYPESADAELRAWGFQRETF
jgi:hypothetical protein